MIKTIIFDIGNVLADFAWEPFFRSFGFSEEVFQKVAKATVKSNVWNELDRGVWTTEEIMEGFVANDPTVEQEIRLICKDLNQIVTKRDYVIPWIQHLKSLGFKVLYLSNIGEIIEEQCKDALSFVPYTDGGIMSYKLRLIKPDAAIYQALIDQYNLKPAECVFVDDTLVNVGAAKKLGFHTVHAVSHEVVLTELEKLGVPSYIQRGANL